VLSEQGKKDDSDDFGSALIFSGGLLHRLRVRNEEFVAVLIGAPIGGIYREHTQLANGQIVLTRITYEHPRLAELNEALAFIFTPDDADRHMALRRRLRRWGRRGIRVWGARTI
jgi:hypothetical protein